MILFNRLCLLIALLIILLLNLLPKKYLKELRPVQYTLLGIEIWAALNMVLLTIFEV